MTKNKCRKVYSGTGYWSGSWSMYVFGYWACTPVGSSSGYKSICRSLSGSKSKPKSWSGLSSVAWSSGLALV